MGAGEWEAEENGTADFNHETHETHEKQPRMTRITRIFRKTAPIRAIGEIRGGFGAEFPKISGFPAKNRDF